jgi:glycolate oxidase
LSLAKELAAIVGAEGVLTEAGDLAAYASDSRIEGVPPTVVALPTTVVQVQEIVRVCVARRTPLIPRGAGTGTVGGATPAAAALVLDLSRMNRILAVDRDNLLADVEAGVVTGEFQRAMEAQGLFYPPDPASSDSSTLGGNAATNAGGLRAVKYGVTADWIAALDVVLADGQLIRAGVRTRKGAMGYDLARLFVGSEGTLGVITGLTVRLLPKPAAKQTVLGLFTQLPQAGQAALAILRGPVTPAAMELMDATAIAATQGRGGEALPPGLHALLLDADGQPDAVAAEIDILAATLRDHGAAEVRHAADQAEADRFWSTRRSLSQALYSVRPQRSADDVTVPVSRLVELIEGVARIAEQADVLQACFGHAGDGNVHVNLLYDPGDTAEVARVKRACEELFRLTLALGGTLSGEHGVGLAKRPYLAWEQGPTLIDLQRRLKRALDPLNILNPGKVLP